MSETNEPAEESSEPLPGEPQSQAEEPPTPPPGSRKSNRWKVIAIVAAIVVVIASAATSAYFLLKPSEEKATPQSEITEVIKTYYASAQDADVAKFKTTVCAPLAEFALKNKTDGQIKALAKQSVDVDGRYVVEQVQDIKISGDRATAVELGHSQGGRLEEIGQQRHTVGLNKLEGAWKICNRPADDPATAEKKDLAKDKSNARKAVEDYYQKRTAGDRDAVILATCGDLRDRYKKQDSKAFADEIKRSPETLKSIDEVDLMGAAAKVTVTIDAGGPSVRLITLSEEAYRWKLCKIAVLE
jgi:hypothetical protein